MLARFSVSFGSPITTGNAPCQFQFCRWTEPSLHQTTEAGCRQHRGNCPIHRPFQTQWESGMNKLKESESSSTLPWPLIPRSWQRRTPALRSSAGSMKAHVAETLVITNLAGGRSPEFLEAKIRKELQDRVGHA